MSVLLSQVSDPCNISVMNTGQRTIVRLWRDAVASGRPDPLHLAEGDGEWVPVSLAETARRVDELLPWNWEGARDIPPS